MTALRDHFHAELTPLDFTKNHSASVAAIHGWIAKQTQQLVPRLLSDGDVTTETTLLLASTVFFKAAWEHGFDPRQTRHWRVDHFEK